MQIDKEGNIWIGSDRGINIFNPTYQSFYSIDNTDLPTKGILSHISKKPFETSTGDILIGTIMEAGYITTDILNLNGILLLSSILILQI
jgi:ligand-binding sensor domain-containing protein